MAAPTLNEKRYLKVRRVSGQEEAKVSGERSRDLMRDSKVFKQACHAHTRIWMLLMGVLLALSICIPLSVHGELGHNYTHHIIREQIQNPYHSYLVIHIRNLERQVAKLQRQAVEAEKARNRVARYDEMRTNGKGGSDFGDFGCLIDAVFGIAGGISSALGIPNLGKEIQECEKELETVPVYIDKSEGKYWCSKVKERDPSYHIPSYALDYEEEVVEELPVLVEE